MHKTLHKKLTEKHIYSHSQTLAFVNDGGMLLQESDLLRQVAKDLLQPRPQAVATLLKMAREI